VSIRAFAKTASIMAAGVFIASAVHAEDPKKDIFLHQLKDVSGIVFNPKDKEKFTVSTPHGILTVRDNGLVKKLNKTPGYFMELISHPNNPNVMFGSGHVSKTEKMGVMRSEDGGRNWQQLGEGAKGKASFYAMTISPINPRILYGVDEAIQASSDGGKTWQVVSPIQGERMFDIAVSPLKPKTVYAGTFNGLFKSEDGAKTWKNIGPLEKPVTSLQVTKQGEIHAFIYDYGYISASEKDLNWKRGAKEFQKRALLNATIDPRNPQHIYGVSDTGAMMISKDSGNSWDSFEGHQYSSAKRIKAGKQLYEDNCLACHGENGIGENPDDPAAVDDNGLPLAPSLNDTMHAWHHSDEQLMSTILNGSPRNERMTAWKEQDLTKEDAESLVAYMKSLWNFNSLSCQGPRHMSCMH
jgi:mono/diheme cytochrome c family protein